MNIKELAKSFVRNPNRERRARHKSLLNYKNGKFQNIEDTPFFTGKGNLLSAIIERMKIPSDASPKSEIPHQFTDIKALDSTENVLIWFGHSSYFMQVDGKKILVDPILCGHASPFSWMTKSFAGSDVYKASDIPAIDFLFITHDHWDHLDYQTVEALKNQTSKVICGLGVGQHFEYWGWEKKKIEEHNWGDRVDLGNGFQVNYTPARHFGGRSFRRNTTLWTSFVLTTPTFRIFIGGDSGYGKHFKEIGEQFGSFDLAILECGQYNEKWVLVHSFPEETVKAAKDLGAKCFLPVHHSKFLLAQHSWYEPLERVTVSAETNKTPVLTPLIGEKVKLENLLQQSFCQWWKRNL
ncbi:MAG: MBL fold metallo-hydrolase [Bacteroidia bacterium]|nr:MBL fold metallo-hydrolase [Bacteroidia bacterium]